MSLKHKAQLEQELKKLGIAFKWEAATPGEDAGFQLEGEYAATHIQVGRNYYVVNTWFTEKGKLSGITHAYGAGRLEQEIKLSRKLANEKGHQIATAAQLSFN